MSHASAARSTNEFPKRWIHLDFHTGPGIPDVGRDFEPEAFARMFKDAHVDCVTLFGMCHHGHLYYNTDHEARHPSLPKDLNLLAEQIEALHRVGIKTPIYLSVQVNEFAANEHPEWIALTPELQHVKNGGSAFRPAWQIMDMSSPYADYFADILAEVLQKFAPTDGLFLDMCWDQPSASPWAIKAMKKAGLDPMREEDRRRYARQLAHSYMERYSRMVQQAHSEPVRIWFNSRPKTNLWEEQKFLHHVEIESLPTGGWGYAYFPYTARFVRPLGLPTLGMTGRFFRSWGDNASLKPFMALKYECCQILSQGMASSVGDLLHPRGVPSQPVYDLIGGVYEHIAACEPYVEGGTLQSQIGVVVDPDLGDNPGPAGLGVVRALQQQRQQFDVLPPDADLSRYELVIIPETTCVDTNLRSALEMYAANGGALLFSGPGALDANGLPVFEAMGFAVAEDVPEVSFLHAEPAVAEGLENYGYVMYEPSFGMAPEPDGEVLVYMGRSYFPRSYDRFSGHDYTAEDAVTDVAAVVRKGNIITMSVPLFEAFGKHAAPNYCALLGNIIAQLLPQPLVKDDGPSSLETTVIHKGSDVVVHLISFCPERRAEGLDIVEDPFPLVDTTIAIKTTQRPRRVYLAPDEAELEFEYSDGYVRTRVTVLDGHKLLVLEGALA